MAESPSTTVRRVTRSTPNTSISELESSSKSSYTSNSQKDQPSLVLNGSATPFRSAISLNHFRQRLEKEIGDGSVELDGSFKTIDKTSPMLVKLRSTPAGVLKAKQHILIKKHEESRQKVDTINVGGGISLWPNMENMRLTGQEVAHLAAMCLGLLLLVGTLFFQLHGSILYILLDYYMELSNFQRKHIVDVSTSQGQFEASLLKWHFDFRNLLGRIHQSLDTSKVPVSYLLYICTYTAGLGTLIYYLADNMFSSNKLSPKRIKKWVCLLTVIGSWTVFMAYLLMCAYMVEVKIVKNVHLLSETLADVVHKDLNCDKLHAVLLYWKTRCLPPTGLGTLQILGLVAVQDVIHYIQYYCLPILTVLVTPILKLISSLLHVYTAGTRS